MRDTQSIAAELNAGMTTPPLAVAAPTTFEPIDRFCSLSPNLPATLTDDGSSCAQASHMPTKVTDDPRGRLAGVTALRRAAADSLPVVKGFPRCTCVARTGIASAVTTGPGAYARR